MSELDPSTGVVAALQSALAAEHAAVHALGALGAVAPEDLSPTGRDALRTSHAVHRARRDHLRSLLRDRGETPVAAVIGDEPAAGTDPEQACLDALAALVGLADEASLRAWAAEALSWSAVASALGGHPAQRWPGAADLARAAADNTSTPVG